MSSASPSVITRSGSKLARARRPPIIGTVPIGFAMISPSPRKHSATATMQYSARVIRSLVPSLTVPPPSGTRRGRRSRGTWPSSPPTPRASSALAAYAFWNSSSLWVVGDALGEVRAERCLDHAVGEQPRDLQRLHRAVGGEFLGVDDLLDAHEPLRRGLQEQVVEVRVDVEVLPVAPPVTAVHVHDREVERQRRCGHQLLAVGVGRGDGADLGLALDEIGAEAHPGGQERHPPRRGLQAEQEQALVHLERADRAGLTGGPEVGLERDRVERAEGVDRLGDLARRAQQPEVGPRRTTRRSDPSRSLCAMARTTLIGLRRDPHPPMPMVMPSRSSATTSASVISLSLTSWCPFPSSRRTRRGARRPTPERFSSNVKPCSKR